MNGNNSLGRLAGCGTETEAVADPCYYVVWRLLTELLLCSERVNRRLWVANQSLT
jgi:hypothetical protein